MHWNRNYPTLVMFVVIALMAHNDVVMADLTPLPPEFPMVGIRVPSATTAFIATALFTSAVFAALYKRRLLTRVKWWTIPILVVLLAALSAAVCQWIHDDHRDTHEKQRQERFQDIGNYLTN